MSVKTNDGEEKHFASDDSGLMQVPKTTKKKRENENHKEMAKVWTVNEKSVL